MERTRTVEEVDWRALRHARLLVAFLLWPTAGACGEPSPGSLGAPCLDDGTCWGELECGWEFRCEEPTASPCSSVDCGDHGTCVEVGADRAACVCAQGYHSGEQSCVANDPLDPCLGITCGGVGSCAILYGDTPICLCDPGHHELGALCVENDPGDPCLGVGCGAEGFGACVVYQGLPACSCNIGLELVGTTCHEPWRNRWTRLDTTTSPPEADRIVMVYDSARERVLAHYSYREPGGGSPALTWELVGDQWREVETVTTPPPRNRHGLAYDIQRDRVVLFGGVHTDDGTVLADTWELDGTDWMRVTPSATPLARLGPAMAYDAASGLVVMSGGRCSLSAPCEPGFLKGTWGYDGQTWTLLWPDSGLSSDVVRVAAYVPEQGKIYAYGGELFPQCLYSDYLLHTFADDAWLAEYMPNTPWLASPAALAWDRRRERLVLFGRDCEGGPGQTWLFNGSYWEQLNLTESPDSRVGGGMVYDEARQRVVLIGGLEAGTDAQTTWTLHLDPLWPDTAP